MTKETPRKRPKTPKYVRTKVSEYYERQKAMGRSRTGIMMTEAEKVEVRKLLNRMRNEESTTDD